MSNVTDVCVLADLYEPCEAQLRALGFVNVADHAGGNGKRLQASCWLGAFNYLREEEMAAALRALSWNSWALGAPTLVLINRENDDGWAPWLSLRPA